MAEQQASDSFGAIIRSAESARELSEEERDNISADSMLSSGLKQEDLYALAVKLKKHEWSLEKYGDVGITVLEKAFCGCIYKLATFDDGAAYLVKLMEDKNMDWDAGHSLVLQDAIVRCGKDALPHLQKVRNHPDLAERCIEMINQGAKTAL